MTAKSMVSRFLSAVLILSATLLLSGCTWARQAADAFYGGLGKLVVGEPQEAEAVSEERYAYQQLEPEEQTVYNQIVETVEQQAERAPVSTESEKTLERAYTAVMADYGEFFWVPATATTPTPAAIRSSAWRFCRFTPWMRHSGRKSSARLRRKPPDGWRGFRLKPGITRRRSLSMRH